MSWHAKPGRAGHCIQRSSLLQHVVIAIKFWPSDQRLCLVLAFSR